MLLFIATGVYRPMSSSYKQDLQETELTDKKKSGTKIMNPVFEGEM